MSRIWDASEHICYRCGKQKGCFRHHQMVGFSPIRDCADFEYGYANEKVLQVAKLRLKGWTYRRIGEKLGINITDASGYFYAYCKDHPEARTKVAELKTETKKKVFELHKQGLSQRKIAEETGLTQGRVWQFLHGYEKKPSSGAPRSRLNREDREKRNRNIRKDYNSGMTYRDLHEKYGLAEGTISEILFRYSKRGKNEQKRHDKISVHRRKCRTE